MTWCSSNTSVATVNPTSGLVMAQGAGTATIYATAQDGSGKYGSCAICVASNCANETASDKNEIIFTKLDELHQIAIDYDSSNAMYLVLQFIRKNLYNGSMWQMVAGEINQDFVTYVIDNNPELYHFFNKDILTVYDSANKPVDFIHLCATMNGIIVGGTVSIEGIIIGSRHVGNLSGWAGDLQTLVIDTIEETSNSDDYNVFYNTFYRLMGDTNYSFSLADLFADVDAYNFSNNWMADYWGSNLFGSACRYYYSDTKIPDSKWTSQSNLRFSQFIENDSKDDFKTMVSEYTDDHYRIGPISVKWPIYNNQDISVSSNQQAAARDAFTNYIWSLYESEECARLDTGL